MGRATSNMLIRYVISFLMSFLLRKFLSESGQILRRLPPNSRDKRDLRAQLALCHPAFISL
jgi:hypothetical protein